MTANPTPAAAAKLRRVVQLLDEITREVDSESARPSMEEMLTVTSSDMTTSKVVISNAPRLALRAEEILRERALRERYIDKQYCTDPAWEILLDLFHEQTAGRRVSVTSACHASRTPATTALRWIKMLETSGLVVRVASRDDGRVFYLHLTKEAYAKIGSYLAATMRIRGA